MRTALLCSVLLAFVVMLAGCGQSGGGSAQLTPEQKAIVDQSQELFAKIKAEAKKLIDENEAKASDQAKAALASLESALTNAEKKLDDLRNASSEQLQSAKEALDKAMADLQTKLSEAMLKVKAGVSGLKIPSL